VLAARADITAVFPRGRLDDAWPETRLVLVPAPLTSTSSSLLHMRTSWWAGAADYVRRGGVLYLSCSADTAIPEMASFAGCRIADRARADRPASLRFVSDWGPFAAGDVLELPEWRGDLHTRGVRLTVNSARTVAVDADGAPALVIATIGAGITVTCAYPVELLLAGVPDAHGSDDATWGLYDGLAKLAGIVQPTRDPDVTAGVLRGEGGSLTVVTNHGPSARELKVTSPDGSTHPVSLEPYGFALLPTP
jgi:beta-galactosidase